MSESYYNTTPIHDPDLAHAVAFAEHQDQAVLEFFSRGGVWSPSMIWQYGQRTGRQWLLTSVRRSITTLTKAGALKMTGAQVDGPYGRKENTWSKA